MDKWRLAAACVDQFLNLSCHPTVHPVAILSLGGPLSGKFTCHLRRGSNASILLRRRGRNLLQEDVCAARRTTRDSFQRPLSPHILTLILHVHYLYWSTVDIGYWIIPASIQKAFYRSYHAIHKQAVGKRTCGPLLYS